MDAQSRQIIEDTLSDCARDLFEHYGVALEPDDDESVDSLTVATVVGFAEESARGSIVLRTLDKIVLSSRPFEDTCEEDWLGELGNQFIGRVKSRLANYGVTFNLGVPTTLRGNKLRFSWGLKSQTFKARLKGELGSVQLLLGALFDDEPWTLVEQVDSDQAEAGDLLLF